VTYARFFGSRHDIPNIVQIEAQQENAKPEKQRIPRAIHATFSLSIILSAE
jgi:hypothetical protein